MMMVCALATQAAPIVDQDLRAEYILGSDTGAPPGHKEHCELFDLLEDIKRCNTLWLDESFSSESQMDILASQLENPKGAGLQSLIIQNASLGDKGAIRIAKIVGQNHSSLHSLALMASGIGDEGAKALAEAVNSSSLWRLQLEGNPEITAEGAEVLASSHEAIGVFNRIPIAKYHSGETTKLDVGLYPKLGMMEATMLKAVLRSDNPLTEVDLGMHLMNEKVMNWLGFNEEDEKEEL